MKKCSGCWVEINERVPHRRDDPPEGVEVLVLALIFALYMVLLHLGS